MRRQPSLSLQLPATGQSPGSDRGPPSILLLCICTPGYSSYRAAWLLPQKSPDNHIHPLPTTAFQAMGSLGPQTPPEDSWFLPAAPVWIPGQLHFLTPNFPTSQGLGSGPVAPMADHVHHSTPTAFWLGSLPNTHQWKSKLPAPCLGQNGLSVMRMAVGISINLFSKDRWQEG